MTFNNLNKFETFLKKKVAFKTLRFFLKRWGNDVTIFRLKILPRFDDNNVTTGDNVEDIADAALDFYGEYRGVTPAKAHEGDSDPTENVQFEARVLFTNILETPYDAAMSGAFEKQVIYTFDDILTNDVFYLDSDDGTKKKWIVGTPMVKGMTTDIYKVFEVNNLAGDSG